eukprot:Ihof_evm9s120 gene=Ihof_evmTU9s120
MEVRGSFDPSGDLYATISGDGRLKVWETATGNLRQQYTSPTHLADTFTCLAWGSAQGKKGKVAKRSPSTMVAFGTKTGKVVVYSLTGGTEVAVLTGHTDRVNDVAFSPNGKTLYSCSTDKQIMQWDIASGLLTSQWKGDTHSVQSLRLNGDGAFLLSAGRTIKLWDLETKKIVRKYTGHENVVGGIQMTPGENAFVTMATEDRFLNMWAYGEGAKTTAIATLTLEQVPIVMAVAHWKVCRTLAVDVIGQLHIWQPDVEKSKTAKKVKPLAPGSTVSVVCKKDKKTLVPIIGAAFTGEASAPQIIMARGSSLQPTFEIINIMDEDDQELKGSIVLERESQSGLLMDKEAEKKRVKGDNVSDVKMVGAGDAVMTSSATIDRPKKKYDPSESTLEERLQQMAAATGNIDLSEGDEEKVPKADSLARLLAQALHSGDNQLLEEVLGNSTEQVIKNTVKRLPAPHVIPFLKCLIEKFQARPNRGLQLVPWMKYTILTHTSYLVTVPNLPETVGGLYQLVDGRLAVFSKLLALNGRLDLLLSQVTVRGQTEGVDDVNVNPDAVYEEEDTESSGDEDEDEEMFRDSDNE